MLCNVIGWPIMAIIGNCVWAISKQWVFFQSSSIIVFYNVLWRYGQVQGTIAKREDLSVDCNIYRVSHFPILTPNLNISILLLIFKHPVTPTYKKVQVGGQQNISFTEGKKIINSFEMDFVNSFSFLHPLLKLFLPKSSVMNLGHSI